MEIVVRTTDFARVLRLIQALADRKNTIPVLGTLLIRADAKGVSITGTDLELGGVSYCPATVKTPGSVAVPARRLSEYVQMLPEGDLVLKEQSTVGYRSPAGAPGRASQRLTRPVIPSCRNHPGRAPRFPPACSLAPSKKRFSRRLPNRRTLVSPALS